MSVEVLNDQIDGSKYEAVYSWSEDKQMTHLGFNRVGLEDMKPSEDTDFFMWVEQEEGVDDQWALAVTIKGQHAHLIDIANDNVLENVEELACLIMKKLYKGAGKGLFKRKLAGEVHFAFKISEEDGWSNPATIIR